MATSGRVLSGMIRVYRQGNASSDLGCYATRGLATSSRTSAAAKTPRPAQTRKQNAGFGNKKKGKNVRKGGELRLLDIKDQNPDFVRSQQRLSLPTFADVSDISVYRSTPVAFSSGRGSLIDTFGAPRSLKAEKPHLSQSFSIVRDSSRQAFENMRIAESSMNGPARYVLTGDSGTGKSTILLQTAEYCASRGWFVLYIPRALEWVNSTSAFQYDAQSQIFSQTVLSCELLQKALLFNREASEKIFLSEPVAFEKTQLEAGTSLRKLMEIGIADPTEAPAVLEAVVNQLAKQSEVPILFAVDDLQALYQTSLYRNTSFERLEAYHLSLPRLALNFASGKQSFSRGAFVGALSTQNTDFPIPIELRDALDLGPNNETMSSTAWLKRNEMYASFADGLERIPLPSRLLVDEAAALVEVWHRSEGLHSDLNESIFLAKLAETGGNPREFVHRGYLSTLVPF